MQRQNAGYMYMYASSVPLEYESIDLVGNLI